MIGELIAENIFPKETEQNKEKNYQSHQMLCICECRNILVRVYELIISKISWFTLYSEIFAKQKTLGTFIQLLFSMLGCTFQWRMYRYMHLYLFSAPFLSQIISSLNLLSWVEVHNWGRFCPPRIFDTLWKQFSFL